MHDNENEESIKSRHREMWHWGRYIREAVECFGIGMDKSPHTTYYHGVSTSMIFGSTSICLYGPVSTTASYVFICF